MGVDQVASFITGLLGAVLVEVGLLDKGWRQVDIPSLFKGNPIYEFLAHNSPTLTILMGTALTYLMGDTCAIGDFCLWGAWVTGFVGAVLVQLGLLDASWRSRPPLPRDAGLGR